MTTERLEKEALGELIPCAHCGAPTYSRANLPEGFCTLPEGLTAGNARMFVYVRERRILVCTNCRYNAYGAY